MKKSLLFAALILGITFVHAQVTYYWVGGAGPTAWGTAANWNTTLGGGGSTRATPASTDILVFDGTDLGGGYTGAVTVNALVAESIGQLHVINNANVSIGHSSTRTITITGGTGDDFTITAGATLTVGYTGATSAITLALSSGTNAVINGTLTLQLASHKFNPTASAGSISFESGSIFNHNVSSGSAFSNGTANSTNNNIIFKNGSTFNFGGGANPFVAAAPASVTQFEQNSTYVHNTTGAPSVSGRYYGNFTLNASISISTGMGLINTLTINSGRTLTLTSTGRISLTGDFINNGAIVTSGPSYPDLLLCGSGSLQTVDFGASTPTFRSVSVGTDAMVLMQSNCNVAGGATGNIYGTLDLQDKTMAATGTGTVINIRNESVVNTTLSSALSANSNVIVTPSSSGVSNGMLVTSPAFPPNTYVIGTSSGTFTLSKYSISALPSGSDIVISNGNATVSTSNSGGLSTALSGYETYSFGGNYIFSGTTATPFPAAVSSVNINNLTTLSNVTLNIPVGIGGTLSVVMGSLNTADNLTIRSTSTFDGRIGNVFGTINGDVNIQRYIPAKSLRKWSLLASPVNQTIGNGWQQQIHITGSGTGGTPCPSLTPHTEGFDATETNNPSIFVYDALSPSGFRWIAPLSTNLDNLQPGKAFRVMVRGPRSTGCSLLDGSVTATSAVTLVSKGAISNAFKNSGSFSISYDNNLLNNWVFVGNPYPSAISFSSLHTLNSSTVSNTYAMYVPQSPSGVYSYWDPLSNTFTGGTGYNNATGDLISSGQAFFLQATVPVDVTLNFDETVKTTNAATGYFRTNNAGTQNLQQIRIGFRNNQGTQLDEVLVRYNNDKNTSNAVVGAGDITSMNSGMFFMYSLKGNTPMVINQRSFANARGGVDEVALHITAAQSGNYQLSFSQYENLVAQSPVYLKDNYTNTLTEVTDGSRTYNFTVDVNKPASFGSNRFVLIVGGKKQATELPVFQPKLIVGDVYPNPATSRVTIQLAESKNNYRVNISNMSGKVLQQQQLSAGMHQLNLSKLTPGTYIIEAVDAEGNRSSQTIIKQ
jgi:hypothetical protein